MRTRRGRTITGALLGVVVASSIACGSGTTDDCIDRYPRDEYGLEPADGDYGRDMWTGADLLVVQCALNGQLTEPDSYISREAARCIGERELSPGLEGVRTALACHAALGPVWSAETTLEEEPYEASGESLLLEAETGEVVKRGRWRTFD